MKARSALLLVIAPLVACGTPSEHVARAPKKTDEHAAPEARTTSNLAGDVDSKSTGAARDESPVVAVPVRRPGAYANLDPSDDFVVGPPDLHADCEAELARAGVKFRTASLPVHVPRRSTITCGAPQVVTYLRGPGNIAYNAPPVVTCSMALALASFERIVQNEALAIFGSPIARINQLGTYNCREMAAYPGWVSEHSYANAIDIDSFALKSGKVIDVLRDFDIREAPPSKPAASFLRLVSRRANDEDVFSHVLTPFFDAHHRNHFHLDLARYRSDGTRPQGDTP